MYLQRPSNTISAVDLAKGAIFSDSQKIKVHRPSRDPRQRRQRTAELDFRNNRTSKQHVGTLLKVNLPRGEILDACQRCELYWLYA